MMHWLFPESIDLEKVKFQAKDKEEFVHNFGLLQDSFVKTGVNRVRASFASVIFISVTYTGYFGNLNFRNETLQMPLGFI